MYESIQSIHDIKTRKKISGIDDTRLKPRSETGTWTKVDQNNVQATELRFFRQVAECIILDDKLNIDVRRELDIFYFIG
jgi:hypothetical protein